MKASNSDPSIEGMWLLFQRVVECDTSPGEGQHRVPSDDPGLTAFIDEIARPELETLGATTHRDSAGNLIATFGPRTGHELLLVAYPATHHANLMTEPLRARTTDVDGRRYWVGQGASEGKGSFVSLVDALHRARDRDVPLDGRLIVAVSTEGSSTNRSSNAMFDEMPALPAAAVLVIGTGNKIALGHRGRADVIVTATGVARHSSVAAGMPSPITDICEAEQRLLPLQQRWAARGSPPGLRSITAYRLVCGPIAPHTMPERCELALDCRFLPGDDVQRLRADIAEAIGNDAVDVTLGPVMLPASTDSGCALVRVFVEAAALAGFVAETFMPPWTFDAGAASSRGVPTILFGPSTDNLSAIDQLDAVSLDMLTQASATLTNVIAAWRR